MDVEKIGKLLNTGYGHEDSKIAKAILIKCYPELIENRNKDTKHITKKSLEEVGIKCKYGSYNFYKEDFPELWEERK